MYKLISKTKCFGDDILGSFTSASDALYEAQRIGMPGEEFLVLNEDQVIVAGIIVRNSLLLFNQFG